MFDDRLRRLREEKKLTQKQVAELLEINPRTYASYENNEREPNSEILIYLSDIFGVTADYLLGIDEIKAFRNNLGRNNNYVLTPDEAEIINSYRILSIYGKNYIKTTFDMCKKHFAEYSKHQVWRAARSEDNSDPKIVEIDNETIQNLRNAPGIKSDKDL